MACVPPPPPPSYSSGWSGYFRTPETKISIEELMETYPDLKELVDKYTEWEILKRSATKDTLEDLK